MRAGIGILHVELGQSLDEVYLPINHYLVEAEVKKRRRGGGTPLSVTWKKTELLLKVVAIWK